MQRRNPARFQPAEGDSLNDMLRKYFEKVRFRKGLEPAVHELDELLIAAEYKPLVLPASLR